MNNTVKHKNNMSLHECDAMLRVLPSALDLALTLSSWLFTSILPFLPLLPFLPFLGFLD